MKEIILDGTKYVNKEELHADLKSKLQLPDYYGNNLDALWDCLTGDVILPMSIVWINFERSKELLGDYAEKTLDLLLKASIVHRNDLKITVY